MEEDKDFTAYSSVEYVKDKRRRKLERDLAIKKQKRNKRKRRVEDDYYQDEE